jgi:hypothetical protein
VKVARESIDELIAGALPPSAYGAPIFVVGNKRMPVCACDLCGLPCAKQTDIRDLYPVSV